jgi:Ca-activated chloride channel family protein
MTHPTRIAALLALVLPIALADAALANGILVADAPATGGGAPVRLVRHTVRATIRDRVADVVVEQTFHSDASIPLEGTYVFPLPRAAAVARFAMTMGGTIVEGEVVEATRARRVYEEIVSRRRDPGLLEWVGQGLYRARVFPIEPGADLTIRLAFQEVLVDDLGTLEWRYPLATDRLNGSAAADVSVTATIESPVDLRAVYSPSHRVDVERQGERAARVAHERTGVRQDRDFVLYVGRSPDDVGFSLVSGKGVAEDGTFMAVIAPRLAPREGRRLPKDVVYVLDTSGSMEGEKIAQAREALVAGIRRLHADDRFALLAFATAVRPFRDVPVAASAEAKEAAVEWIRSLSAEGGTNIEGALASAARLCDAGRLTLVVFVTDGRPTVGEADPDALLRLAGGFAGTQARVFTFGVGHDLDVSLLDRIAERTGGAREYVAPGEDIARPTDRLFRKTESPVLRDVTIDLGAGVHDVHPARLPDLFAGEQVVLFGRYREAGARTVRLRGRLADAEVTFSHEARLSATAGPDFLPRLWAHRKVAFLLDAIRLHGEDRELVDEVTRLASRFAIVTPYTSGLVLEEGDRARPALTRAGSAAPGARPPDLVAKEPISGHASTREAARTDHDLPFEEELEAAGLSGAPFEGPRANALLGLGASAPGPFSARGSQRDVRTGGAGTTKTWDAVDDALAWLSAHRSPGRGWESAGFDAWCDGRPVPGDPHAGRGEAGRDVGATGLALLAFLSAGYTNRGDHPFAKTTGDGLRLLKDAQGVDGRFGDVAVDHAIAALAMVEA